MTKESVMPPEFEKNLRIAIGTALIQSGYLDQDPIYGTINALQWHPCPECPGKGERPCACAGVPYLSDEVWEKINFGGYFTAALDELDNNTAKILATSIEYEQHFQKEWEIRMALIKRWQDENPEDRFMKWPDYKNLLEEMYNQIIRGQKLIDAVKAYYDELVRLKHHVPHEEVSSLRSDRWPFEVDLCKAFEEWGSTK